MSIRMTKVHLSRGVTSLWHGKLTVCHSATEEAVCTYIEGLLSMHIGVVLLEMMSEPLYSQPNDLSRHTCNYVENSCGRDVIDVHSLLR